MRRKVRYLTFWITMALWFGQGGGCTPPLNEANFGLPALKAPVSTDFSGQPSLAEGFDRSQWDAVTVELPARMVDTRPAYWEPLTIRSEGSPRSDGTYPTAATALMLEQDTDDIRHQAYEVVLDPFYQLFWMFAIPVRAGFTEQPWNLKQGPRGTYDVVPVDPALVILYPDAETDEDASDPSADPGSDSDMVDEPLTLPMLRIQPMPEPEPDPAPEVEPETDVESELDDDVDDDGPVRTSPGVREIDG